MDEKVERIGKKTEVQDDRAWLEAKESAEARDAEQDQRIENLYAHAEQEHGFSAYEGSAITSKQALKDLCQEYELYCSADPVLKDFIGRVKKYAELDAPAGEPYHEEVNFIKSLPAVFEQLDRRLQAEEADIQAEIEKAFPTGAPAKMTEEQRQQDRLLVAREAALENKQRIVASLGVYFDTLTMGGLTDSPMDRGMERESDELALQEALKNSYQTALLGKNGSIQFLNTVGQELDVTIPEEEAPAIARVPGNWTARDVKRPDAPLFPHEPRMNDVKQGLAGECYLYAGLQDLARLYPQKLKDAVKDNGDGTATVRFFQRSKNPDGSKTYQPVYVRVEKATTKLAAWERGGQESMWVNVIERAYAMSGIHLTHEQDSVRPVSTEYVNGMYRTLSQPGIQLNESLYREFPWIIEKTPVRGAGENDPQYTYRVKEWKPSVASIEGGDEANFLETLLGEDFQSHEIGIPDIAVMTPEAVRWEQRLKLSGADITDPAQILRFVMSERVPDGELQAFMTAPEDEFCRKLYETDVAKDFVSEEEYVRTMRETLHAGAAMLAEEMQRSGGVVDMHCAEVLGMDLDKRVPKNSPYTITIVNRLTDALEANWVYAKKPAQQRIFDEVTDKLNKGFPVSAGSTSRRNGREMKVASRHAYSIIGAFKTEDDPPRYYFRMRNPWGDRHMMGALGSLVGYDKNGVQYQKGPDGRETAKWTKMEEGVFDLEVKDFLTDFDKLNYNGSANLENTPHLRTEGYDIITPAQARQQAESTVTDDAFTNYAKAANDLYAALLGTDSSRSNDSPEYKAMKQSAQAFRDSVAASRGRDMDVLKQAATDLQEKAQAYLDHVPKSPSSRQQARMNVCKTIMAVTLCAQRGSKEPAKEIEAQFARKLMEANFRVQKRQVPPEQLDELAEKLTENRAFRTAVNKLNLNQLLNAGENTVKAALKDLSAAAKGKGIDTGLELNTLKTKDYAVKI